jgi:6-phosphofructokinase 1
MHVGILTGGGDCPGLNAVIRAVTLALIGECGARVTGIERGFMGLVTRQVQPLTEPVVRDILAQGGTILGTHNKANPFAWFGAGGADVSADAMAYVRELGLDVLVALGGDGTMEIAHRFERLGLPVVGVPKTIDNDLHGTDRSFGFDSAVHVVAEALDRLHTTALSHHRVMIAETMGRHAGWIALEGGIAGGADMILLPELPFDIDQVAAFCRAREATHGCTLICVAEGAHAQGQPTVTQRGARLGGIGQWLQAELEQRLPSEVRATLLGHVQRGGSPTPFDRVLATRLGHQAAQLVRRGEFGHMVVLQGDTCTSVPIADVAGKNRLVPLDHPLLAAARSLGVGLGR